MDENLGVKVIVTRLRRRSSVESEESNSPSVSAPSTPSKKRGGRLAAKPQLELIDEDANENVPKRTRRKSVARDAVEPEEKVLTPARRSARIRSNTSLLAEAAAITPKVTDSPRAKRAARRNSQLGSDNETQVATPKRQTRRTRKDSTNSGDIIPEIPAENDNVVLYVITSRDAGEPANVKESNNNSESNKSNETSDIQVKKTPDRKVYEGAKSKSDSILQLSRESTQSSEIANNVTPEKDKQSDELTIPSYQLSPEEENITPSVNNVEVGTKESKPLNNITPEIVNDKNQTDNNTTKEDITEINSLQLNKSKLDLKEKLEVSSYEAQIEKSDVDKLLENDPSSMQSVVVIDDSDSNSGKLVMDVPHEGEDQCVPVVHSNHFVNDAAKTFDEVEPMDIDESVPLNVTLNDFESFVESNTDYINQTTKLSKNDSRDLKNTTKVNASNRSLNKSKRTSSISVPSEYMNENKNSKSERRSSVSISLDSSLQNINMDALNKSNKSYSEIKKDENKKSEEVSSRDTNKENQNEKPITLMHSAEVENNSPDNIVKTNRKSSISLSENSEPKTPNAIETKNNESKSRNSSSHNIMAEKTDTNSDIEKQINKSKRKSSLKAELEDSKSLLNIGNKSLNESNKNNGVTTVAQADSQNLEKSTNENKSTLVISQLKDISSNDTKNASKSPDESNNDLSKSVTVTDIAKNAKNNISNVLTSTPLQQKSLKNLGMQINSSMISPNTGNKTTEMITNKTAPSLNDSDSDSSEDEEKAVKNKSKIIDDEASEASEDYESGDSRDDEERRYAEENEIREKGETLESEKDFSNDSDYEKDSFVVSSDAEDDDMLSGTGDDLSLSDRELTMSKKSKKKFDERKRKEQKKASKEMFEARHNINKSKNDSQSDKVKTKKKAKPLESSDNESEEETEKPKQKKRMRIDSSLDASVLKSDGDESIGHKKKKAKRLSESVCEDNVNEKEITICNESISNKNDPLSASIKLEPKTPQRDFNISTVPIVDKIEEVELDGNKTIVNPNETSDPLQTTLAQDQDSLSSENMEIMQNYDSVLNNLNNQQKVKSLDMSLNIEKKHKTKSKESIIDQLNLTQTKKNKKDKTVNQSFNENKKSTDTNKNVSKVGQDEESSDSIDMKLLFPEDSNDSEVNVNKIKDKNTNIPTDEYIPLKRTEGKTHIPETMDTSSNLNNSKLNKSKSKKEKHPSQSEAQNTSEPADSLNFFIDVTGNLDHEKSHSKKKKNKKKYFNDEDDAESKQDNSIIGDNYQNVTVNDEAPTEVSFKSDKKKKKKNKHLNTTINGTVSNEADVNNEEDTKDKDANNAEQSENTVPDQSLNTSVKSEKKKKKKKGLDVSNVETNVENDIEIQNVDTKKKSRKTSENLIDENVNVNIDINEPKTIPETSFNSEKKKHKKKHNISNLETNSDNTQENTQFSEPNADNLDISLKSDKKKKKKHKNDISITEQSFRLGELFETEVENTEDVMIEPENTNNEDTSIASEKKKKKKHKKKQVVENEDNAQSTEQDLILEVDTSSKKKKKDKVKETTQGEESDDAPEEVSFKFEKATTEEINEQRPNKKRKLETEESEVTVKMANSKKKRKISGSTENTGEQNAAHKSKKRKRDDSGTELEDKEVKVSKDHSLDKIHIPRLPISLLEKLEDEPQVPMKRRAIATSEFVVEDARPRKNKPSTYLEQSIYLNDTPKKNKKKHKVKNNPVLPFIPTAETSDKGFTSIFKINVLSETPFVASNTANFKNDYLAKQRIKKMGTFERFKSQRSHKLSKF